MKHHIPSAASFLAFVLLAGPSYAAEPDFSEGLITESRTYEREELVTGGPTGVQPINVSINRVTVELEGERISGEWKPGPLLHDLRTTAEALAKNFPAGADVQATTSRNRLLLKRIDGSVVDARIVDRVALEGDEHQR